MRLQRCRALDEAARLIERAEDDENLARLSHNRVYHLLAMGRLEAAAHAATQDRAAMREIGLERSLLATSATANESEVLVDLGRFDDARAILDDAVGLVQPDWWRAWALQARVWLNWVTGDLDGAEGDLAEIRRLAPELTEGQTYGPHARAVAAVALETEHWDTAVQTAADAVRQLPEEEGLPVVHWETMTVAWLGLWAAAELTRERGESGSVWLAPHLAELDRLLDAAARRPSDKRTVRDRALLALCQAERRRVAATASSADWHSAVDALDALGAVAATRLRARPLRRASARRERRPQRRNGGARRGRVPARRRAPVAGAHPRRTGRPPSTNTPHRAR